MQEYLSILPDTLVLCSKMIPGNLPMLSFLTLRYRWVIVALLFALSVVNDLDRQTLSILAPTLRDLHRVSTAA